MKLKKENADKSFHQGKQMLMSGELEKALALFTRAIEQNPSHAEALQARSTVLDKMGRTGAADADRKRVAALSSQPTASQKQPQKNVQKIDMSSVDNIFDDLTSYGDDVLDFDDDLFGYADTGSDAAAEDLIDDAASHGSSHSGIPAYLDYLDGRGREIPWARLFEPTDGELTLETEEDGIEIISLEQLRCIRLARVPAGFSRHRDPDCHVEIIETCDGHIYHEAIHPEQPRNNILFGFSTRTDSRYKYTMIPRQNIKKRFQRRHLGQILTEKQLVNDDILKNALNEHNELKKVKFGRILAEQAQLLYSAVENEIQKAYTDPGQKLRIGEILLNAGLVSEEQIDQALAYQRRLQKRKLGHFLVEKGVLQEKDLYQALSEKFRIPFVDLREQKGSRKALSLLPREVILKLQVLPLSVTGNKLIVATAMPDPAPICEVVLRHCPVKDIEFVLTQPTHLRRVIRRLFQPKK